MIRSIILISLCLLLCSPVQGQNAESARKNLETYSLMVSQGNESVMGYNAAYNACKEYLALIKAQTAGTPEFDESKRALKKLFDAMNYGAYFYSERNDVAQATRFAQLYVDISLLYCMNDEHLTEAKGYTELPYFAACNTHYNKEYEKAIPFCRAYLSTSENNPERREDVFSRLVEGYYNLKNYDDVKYLSAQALQKYPRNVYIINCVLGACKETDDEAGLERYLDYALAVFPNNDGLLHDKAFLMEKRLDYSGAIEYWKKFDMFYPNNLTAYYHLAFDYYNAGVALHKQSLTAGNKNDKQTFTQQAKFNFNQAIPYLEDIISNDPYATNVAEAIAICYAQTGNTEGLNRANTRLGMMSQNTKVTTATVPVTQTVYKGTTNLPTMTDVPKPKEPEFVSDVDRDLPQASVKNTNTYAVIFGNEKYKYHSEVKFAHNDAKSFAEYCKTVLGIPESNIRLRMDASLSELNEQVRYLENKSKMNPDELNFIFYYAGHGIPDVSTGTAYLLPCDASGTDMESCLSLEKLYARLDNMPVKGATVFLDACFSGATRQSEMLFAERFVEYAPEEAEIKSNTVVFSATKENQTAMSYDDQHHGFFTYYLLQNLKESQGKITFERLGANLTKQVDNKAYDLKNKHQTPQVRASESMGDSWKTKTLFQ